MVADFEDFAEYQELGFLSVDFHAFLPNQLDSCHIFRFMYLVWTQRSPESVPPAHKNLSVVPRVILVKHAVISITEACRLAFMLYSSGPRSDPWYVPIGGHGVVQAGPCRRDAGTGEGGGEVEATCLLPTWKLW